MKIHRLKLVSTSIAITLISFVFSGCCVTFSSKTNGTTYQVGDVITDSGITIKVEQFQYGGGGWTTDGKAKIDNRNWSSGSGLDIGAGNTNLHFLFDYPVSQITIRFGDLGGNSNILVNSELKNLSRLPDVNGLTMDGVSITVNALKNGNNWYGELILEGTINDFAIGGQELWLDNICHKK